MQSSFEFRSRRSPILGRKGMVATSQPLAAAAGVEILQGGGNAADAAVATAAALNVTEPTSTGIGGDAFALYYQADTGKITALNASGRAPGNLNLDRLQQEGLGEELPRFHPYTITIPGACSGWCDLVERHGKLDLGQVFAPAIQLADEGYPVAPITAYFWKRGAERQLSKTAHGRELMVDGRAPRPGEIFRNPGLARTLRAIAEQGKEVFYQGEIAEAIVSEVQRAGGCLRMEDMAAHHATWDAPIHINYKGFNIWECPPNGQGLTALLALNILEGLDCERHDPLSAQRLHYQIESLRLAFADTRWVVSDPEFSDLPVADLLSKEYAARRRQLIDDQQANPDVKRGIPANSSDTVYLTVVDGQGNACSFINSNYMGFGTGIVPEGWGFTLQNRGHSFDLQPGHPNALEPGKRPYHTIIPAMITVPAKKAEDGGWGAEELYASYGVMGGFMQPQGHLQVASGLIDDDLDPQAALDRPRFCITDGTSGGVVAVEEGIDFSVLASLAERGHDVQPVSGYRRAIFGRGQIIHRDRETGVLTGGSDPRADGCAMTW